MPSEWQTFLRAYRNENPDIPFRQAQKNASGLYKRPNTCNKKNLKSKITRMTDSEVQAACRKLNSTEPEQRPITYVLLKKEKTKTPNLSKQDKPSMPSKIAPKRPVVYIEQDLKRELDRLIEKVLFPVSNYFANKNIWTYKKRWVPFTNKLVAGIKKKYNNLRSDERDPIIQQKLGLFKSYTGSTASKNGFKTSDIKYDKIIKFLNDRYNINL